MRTRHPAPAPAELPAPVAPVPLPPSLLTLTEVAAIYRLAPSTVRERVRAGWFVPAPVAVRPYRWHRADVEADLERLARARTTQAVPRDLSRKRSAAARVRWEKQRGTRKAVRRG